MDSRSVKILEFHFILDILRGLCTGPEGESALLEQDFITEREELDEILSKVSYLKRLIASKITQPDIYLPEIRTILSRLDIQGAMLEGSQLVSIAQFIRGSTELYRYVSSAISENDKGPLWDECEHAPDVSEVSRAIFSDLDEDGNVKESLPALRSIRKRMQRAQSDIASVTSAHLRSQESIWQTNVPTQKGGRVVLPLKADHRGRVKGIIREVSSSGATIFIEPNDLVEKNNSYALLENEYKIEVAKVLRRCTESARGRIQDLHTLRRHAAYIDTILARARFAAKYNCFPAEPMERGFVIQRGRHPMLAHKAVPIEVELREGRSVLIISGPNAGGKTVTLKTVGLFALMNQFGMCIPAEEGSGLQIYSGVFADIGDDQSIEESLSTFSAHMKNISRFAEEARKDTLILLDELGAGTDPEEGSAIAMAVLDRFIEVGATVVATTHQSVLKNYGFSKPGVTNASVAFDPQTHLPTYAIVQGLPGESHALEIAESSGMSTAILSQAKHYIDEQSTDVARIIKEISAQQRSLNERESEYDKKREDLLEKIRETDLRALKLKQREMELRTQGYMQLTKQIQESRRELELLVKDLRQGELTKEKTRSVKRFIDTMEQTAEREREGIEEVREELAPQLQLSPGLEVLVGKSKQRGRILRKARKGYWVVSTDKLRITVAEAEIQAIAQKNEHVKKVRIEHQSNSVQPVFALDVRGFRLEAALEELDRQIDRAILTNMQSFELIHGHGEGVLQSGLHEKLKSHPAVRGFEFAKPEEGGFGKTIVRLS